jgi:hypothetical protein
MFLCTHIDVHTYVRCGLALRYTSSQRLRQAGPMETELDSHGYTIGNATVPIVNRAQEMRRAEKCELNTCVCMYACAQLLLCMMLFNANKSMTCVVCVCMYACAQITTVGTHV